MGFVVVCCLLLVFLVCLFFLCSPFVSCLCLLLFCVVIVFVSCVCSGCVWLLRCPWFVDRCLLLRLVYLCFVVACGCLLL